eukprot:222649_1
MAIDTSECLSTNATGLQTELDNLTSLCDMICITNSLREDLDGTYDLLYFNTTVNGPVYHNENNNKYLYPYIISEHEYNYLIQSQSSIGSGRASSSCSIYNPPSGYVFNPYDCFDEWWTYDYYHDDPDQQIWKEDPNQRLVNCNNLVATGNDQRVLDGTYEWSQFSLATGSSIYYCHECGAGVGTYLYTWPDFSEWQIGSDYVSGVRSSKCEFLNTQSNDLISIDDCIQWETWKWSKWILDNNFRVDKEECLLTISTTSVKTSALPIGSNDANENPNDKETLLILGMVFIGISIISFFIWAGISYAKHQKNLKKKQQAVQRTQAHKRELRFQETIELFKNERENRMTRQIELYEENKRKEQQQRQHHVQEIEEILLSRGFEQNYIQRAIKVYELDHGNLDGYNLERIAEIARTLQFCDKVQSCLELANRQTVIEMSQNEVKTDPTETMTPTQGHKTDVIEQDVNTDAKGENTPTQNLMSHYKAKAGNKAKKKQKERIIAINVETDGNDARVKGHLVIEAVYDKQQKMQQILNEIMNRLHQKYYPTQYEYNWIKGFTGEVSMNNWANKSCVRSDADFVNLGNKSITEYDIDEIQKKGLYVYVIIKEHVQQIDNVSITCPEMDEINTFDPQKCKIYVQVTEKCQYSAGHLRHLNEFTHFVDEYTEKPVCGDHDSCKAYKRLENGGNKIEDQCHMKIYRHPPRNRNINLMDNVHAFIINKSRKENHTTYDPTEIDARRYNFNETDGFLRALIEEVIVNGYRSDLGQLGADYQILHIVDEKMNHIRHQVVAQPLRRSQMLALILYTGCACNYDLCEA